MQLSLNTANSFSGRVGEHGITDERFDEIKGSLRTALEALRKSHQQGGLPFLTLPCDSEASEACRKLAERYTGEENLVIAGIGGSALGPRALFSALAHPLHNQLPFQDRDERPRLFILDNVDPDTVGAVLDFCNPRKTVYNIISKSGSTAETAAASLLIFERLQKVLGDDWRKRVVCTTDPESGDLRALCKRENLASLNLPSGVGGRFSVLTPVGLFPAYLLGFDVKELLEGAADMAELCLGDDVEENPAARIAGLLYLFDTQHNRPVHVMMPYADSLHDLADWYRQLWAESLGKAADRDGHAVHVGPTPVKALGTTDQHSQVQLYIEGPQDKVIIFLEVEQFRRELTMPGLFGDVSSLGYLGGQTVNKLMASEFTATREALAQRDRPSMTVTFDEVNARAVGEFLMLFEVATAIAGELYNINAFDQPGVELGKVLTYGLMGREGYEGKVEGIRS